VAAHPNFDPARFVEGADTVYVTAPAHRQALAAPLVVGLLEQVRHAVYARAAAGGGGPAVLWCLDELANIAPLHDLPALVSEAGGQGLHVVACLQDLSQARARWGAAAEGFLSLFQTRVLLGGIADVRTLEAVSLMVGEYDRRVVSHTLGRSEPVGWFKSGPPSESESVAYSTTRQRVLSPGEVHQLPAGHALVLLHTQWGLVRLTPAHRCEPWAGLVGGGLG
jgi:type IV secretory pathway TraG/TraD family ATPase VirD4